ncbi:MAG: glycosyltransferase [Planctomycetaceae bacterium]
MPAPSDAAVDLSIITATCQRPKHLAICLAQVRQQSLGNLRVEHLVVSDGPDSQARYLAEQAGAMYFELEKSRGQWGAAAKDAGLAAARGQYVCFWDDDNHYEPHAAVTLFAAVHGVDIGIVPIRALKRQGVGRINLPRQWDGTLRYGDIDTMNFCVRRELALQERWADGNPRSGEDYRWLQRLKDRGASVRYLPVVIGEHL